MRRSLVILLVLAGSGCAHRPAWEIARDIRNVSEPPGQDFWQSPQETLRRGAGDCEDVAILLWWLLREAGVKDGRVVFGRLHAFMPQYPHAWVEIGKGVNAIIMDPAMELIIPRAMLDYFAYYEIKDNAIWHARAWWFTARTGITGFNKDYEKPLIAPR